MKLFVYSKILPSQGNDVKPETLGTPFSLTESFPNDRGLLGTDPVMVREGLFSPHLGVSYKIGNASLGVRLLVTPILEALADLHCFCAN